MDARTTFTQILRELRSLIVRYRPYHFRSSDLACACGFSSFVIERALQELGYSTEIVIGKWDGFYDHAWVESEGFLLDVTLTQFEGTQPEIKVARAARCRLYQAVSRGDQAHQDFQSNLDSPGEGWGQQSPYQNLKAVEQILAEFRKSELYASLSSGSAKIRS